jgi:hypothetical protein
MKTLNRRIVTPDCIGAMSLFVICFVAIQIVLVSGQTASVSEKPERAGKVAPKPLYRDPIYDAPTDLVLCFNTQEKKWFMFYTSRRATEPNTPGFTWVHGSRIGIAESSDGGATWKYRCNAEIDYTKGLTEYTYWAPEVIYHEGAYHMYLSFVPGVFADWNHPREIIHLTSKDMIKWNFESILDLKSDRVIDACVIGLPNGKWRMWYKDERAKMSLSYADSPDLYKWEARGNAISDRNGEGPKVFHWKGKYWMVADVWKGLGVWSSRDYLNWKPQEQNLPGSHGDVVVSGDRAYLFYFTGLGKENIDPNDPYSKRRAVIQVTELKYKDDSLTCDIDKPTYIQLLPKLEDEN